MPVGGGKGNSAFDEMPVGGGSGNNALDEQPVGGSKVDDNQLSGVETL